MKFAVIIDGTTAPASFDEDNCNSGLHNHEEGRRIKLCAVCIECVTSVSVCLCAGWRLGKG